MYHLRRRPGLLSIGTVAADTPDMARRARSAGLIDFRTSAWTISGSFSIVDGNLILGTFYSVAKVEGQGARARIYKYGKMPPGVHVDGAEAWLYPLEVPR